MKNYNEFDNDEYISFCKDLLAEKGSPMQISFLNSLKNLDDFSDWIEDKLEIQKTEDIPIIEGKLTKTEFLTSPCDLDLKIVEKWKHIKPIQASRTGFWAYVTYEHMRRKVLEPHYLIAAKKPDEEDLRILEKLLADADNSESSNKKIDALIREALRRMSGLHHVRSYRTVVGDCIFGKIWWRGYWANEASKGNEVELNKIINVLRRDDSAWKDFAESIISKHSVLGDAKIRPAILKVLKDIAMDDNKNITIDTKFMKRLSKSAGVKAALIELSFLDDDEVYNEIYSLTE